MTGVQTCALPIFAEGEVLRLEPGALAPETLQSTPENPSGLKAEIEAALGETHGRIAGPQGAAVRLGVPVSTLESRIRALKINKHQFHKN